MSKMLFLFCLRLSFRVYSPPPVMSRRREECRTSEKSNVHRYQSPTVNMRVYKQTFTVLLGLFKAAQKAPLNLWN